MTDTYEIYAIRYGHHPRKAAENFIGGDDHETDMPLDYFVWAIKGAAKTYVLDTGFDPEVAKRRGRITTLPIHEGLRSIGVEPDQVEDVVISHMHYDHAGNLGLFPNARFHIQDAEMAYCTGRCMCHPIMRFPFEAQDVEAMVRRVFEGKVQFHDGDTELAPGITAGDAGEYCARPGGAGVGRHPPLRQPRAQPPLPGAGRRRRLSRRPADPAQAGAFHGPHRSGA
jgi:glyoxylase-like metal-dependent hydrolase (beta-lactamase superfamily II)